jgi:hypothetical protein
MRIREKGFARVGEMWQRCEEGDDMLFPASMADMLRGGYVFLQTTQCRDCGKLIYQFRTPRPRRSIAPFVKTPKARFVSHFAVCRVARNREARIFHPGQGELFRNEDFSPPMTRDGDARSSDAA